ncbi:hypothetical protein [Clostridium sp. B9]|uniref:hypothetical protein n=1 Tax=Clostridium sp. B9 TaxID=3423224 RepID=UPI003D2F3A72
MIKLILINFVLSFILFLVLKVSRRKVAGTAFLLSLAIPYIGFLILLVLFICNFLIKTDHGDEVLKREDKYDKSISLLIRSAELENRKDLISVEEALILNDNHVKRELVKDVLKKDTYKYRKILLEALVDEDTETSHYAATAITQMKSKLTIIMQEFEAEYYRNPKNKKTADMFLQAIKDGIESNIIDSKDVLKLKYLYKNTLKEYKRNFEFSSYHFNELIKTCIDLKEFKRAIEYSTEYRTLFPEEDTPYLLLLEVYYYLNDKESFDNTILDIRKSNIKLTRDSLELLRFWMEGNKDV